MAATPDLAGRESPGEGPLFEADFISQGHHLLQAYTFMYRNLHSENGVDKYCTDSSSRGQSALAQNHSQAPDTNCDTIRGPILCQNKVYQRLPSVRNLHFFTQGHQDLSTGPLVLGAIKHECWFQLVTPFQKLHATRFAWWHNLAGLLSHCEVCHVTDGLPEIQCNMSQI